MQNLLRNAVIALALPGLNACAGSSVVQSDCTGVPGEYCNPTPSQPVPPATHGPGIAAPAAVRLQFNNRRDEENLGLLDGIPMLYVYDDAASFALKPSRSHAALSNPLFELTAQSSFWGEVVDGGFFWVPGLDSSMQTWLLGRDFSFRGPPGGLLFVQYTADGCNRCEEVSQAIAAALAAAPELPARWVQFDVGSAPGRWCHSPAEFEFARDRSIAGSKNMKDYQCLR